MCSSRSALRRAALAAALALGVLAARGETGVSRYEGIGRAATPAEVAAWDIDVRPDFKGLPKGSGSVAIGQELWDAKCASCHGTFGESNEIFSPLVGGTTTEDMASGRVARLKDPAFPARTTLMKVSTLSTLYDYIRRAMPWTAPKSLSNDEVYAVLAYLLNLGGIVPDDFTLSDSNMAEVQRRLPNRDGVTTDHGLWPGRGFGNGGKADVHATACMKDCAVEAAVGSLLPEFARNAHGNLAEQNRRVGAQRGADTTRPAPASLAEARDALALADQVAATSSTAATDASALLRQNNCTSCHAVDRVIVGPALHEVSRKYRDRADAADYLAGKIRSGGVGAWGGVPMPAQALSETDAKRIAQWIADGAATNSP